MSNMAKIHYFWRIICSPLMVLYEKNSIIFLSTVLFFNFQFILCVFNILHLYPIHLPVPSHLPPLLQPLFQNKIK